MTNKNYAPITRCEAITDIIESVAMQEQAIAKILNDNDKDKDKDKDDKSYYDKGYDKGYDKCLVYDPDKDKDKDKDKNKNEDKIELINAVTRLEFFLAAKLYLFINCACPNEGCKNNDKKDYK